jgi:hypothetical protein
MKEATMKNIIQALLRAQQEISNARKDAANPHFRSRYATLESVLEAVKNPLNDHGIAIAQTCGKDSEGHFVETKLIHESGEQIESRIYLVLEKQSMQGFGSALTYGRRLGLASLVALGAEEDDDANRAEREAPKPVQARPAQRPIQQKGSGPSWDDFNR